MARRAVELCMWIGLIAEPARIASFD